MVKLPGKNTKAQFLAQMYLFAIAFGVATGLGIQGTLERDGIALLFWIPATVLMAAVTLLIGYLAIVGTVRWKAFRDSGERGPGESSDEAEDERLSVRSQKETVRLQTARRVMLTMLAVWVAVGLTGPALDLAASWWIAAQAVVTLALVVSFVFWSTLWARRRR
jgi:small-conductance mechanosensitive channel